MSSDVTGSGEGKPWGLARSLDPLSRGFADDVRTLAEAVLPPSPGVDDPFADHARELIAAIIAAAAAKRCFG